MGGQTEAEGRNEEISDDERAALRKSLNLPTDDEAEGAAEDSASENDSQIADEEAATQANRVTTGATGRDDTKPNTVADRAVISETEEVENEAAVAEDEAESEAAVVEDEAERIAVVVGDEVDIMDLTQPTTAAKEVEPILPTLVPDDEAASSDEALNIEKPTTLERVISKVGIRMPRRKR
eukprot:snap_masked-scaffold_5-processed-gene-9.36-mRNA-1 protein AED:1.00 eAED:1.00 QI:0/-1/0/0/-1/1/1/0/180